MANELRSQVPDPVELSSRIGEISLTGLRAYSGNESAPAPTTSSKTRGMGAHANSPEEFLKLNPDPANKTEKPPEEEGFTTPDDPPTVPPPTPVAVVDGTEGPDIVGPVKQADVQKAKVTKKPKQKKEKPTGFEEFYADPPITPAEDAVERELYDEEVRPFHERIQTCLQRYRAKRKLDEVRGNILSKYWALGGIETGVKMFNGGLDKDTLENSTAGEIAAITATDFVRSTNAKFYDPDKPEGWTVSFEDVVKGFFSYRAPVMIGIFSDADIKTQAMVIKNFLNYVLTHEVCKEYTKDVLVARKICDLAEKEWLQILALQKVFPGDYNVAASTLFGGHYSSLVVGDQQWAGNDDIAPDPRCKSIDEAKKIFKTAIAHSGDDELIDLAKKGDIYITGTQIEHFEVTKIEQPDEQTKAEYAANPLLDNKSRSFKIKPLGVITFKPWTGPGIEPEDLSDDEAEVQNSDARADFWLESNVLEHCFIGMKLTATVHQLNVGMKFIDRIEGLYPSFFLYLPNEKMAHWKEPAPNERSAPTEDDPDAEQSALDAEAADDL